MGFGVKWLSGSGGARFFSNKRVMNNSGGQVPVTKTGKNPPQSTEEGVTPLVRDVPGCTLGPLFGYLPSHMKIPVQQNYLINSKST